MCFGAVNQFDHFMQTDYTVWKLNVFVKKALEEQGKNAAEERNVNHNGNFEEKKNTNKRRKM